MEVAVAEVIGWLDWVVLAAGGVSGFQLRRLCWTAGSSMVVIMAANKRV